jgi:hypothetical protein
MKKITLIEKMGKTPEQLIRFMEENGCSSAEIEEVKEWQKRLIESQKKVRQVTIPENLVKDFLGENFIDFIEFIEFSTFPEQLEKWKKRYLKRFYKSATARSNI